MPNSKTHFAISKIRTGKTFESLHKWIDENKEDRGVNHRAKNHFYTDELKNFVSNNFGGPRAVSEWLFHIALDNLDTSVINDWNYAEEDRNFFKFGFGDKFIFYDDKELDPDELESEFSDVYEDDEY
jgi:hypothetical protein